MTADFISGVVVGVILLAIAAAVAAIVRVSRESKAEERQKALDRRIYEVLADSLQRRDERVTKLSGEVFDLRGRVGTLEEEGR